MLHNGNKVRLKAAIYTFGCKVNLFESEQLSKSLIAGMDFVSHKQDADYYIINGCTVTSSTDSQVRNMARRFAKRGKVIITGCYARKDDPFLKSDKNIVVIPTMDEVAEFFNEELLYSVSFKRARPFIKIQDGCDQQCSYCIIPSVRGKAIKSTPIFEIEKLLKQIKADGYNEIVFAGIHVGKYGFENGYEKRISDVVEVASSIIKRVRLSSIEPIEIDQNLIQKAKEGKILPHWHIPLQSGSNNILKLMNRPYQTSDFMQHFHEVYSAYTEHPAIGTDVIVGFPGETDEDFSDTVRLIESLPFAYGHVFPFSPRIGTAAFGLNETLGIPQEKIKIRAEHLRKIFALKREQYINSCIGRKVTMILEEEIAENQFTGTSENYIPITYFGGGAVRELKEVTIDIRDGEIIGL